MLSKVVLSANVPATGGICPSSYKYQLTLNNPTCYNCEGVVIAAGIIIYN